MPTEEPKFFGSADKNGSGGPDRRDPDSGRRTHDSKSKWYAIGSAVLVFIVILVARELMTADEAPGAIEKDTATTEEQTTSEVGSADSENQVQEEPGTTDEQDVPDEKPITDESATAQDEDTAGSIIVQGNTPGEDDNSGGVPSWVELNSMADLGSVAGSKIVVFVFVSADEGADEEIRQEIETAAGNVQAEGPSVGLFSLSGDSSDYALVEAQYSTPCVLVLVRGAGGAAVSEEITEATLISAVAAAAQPGCC